MLGVYVPRASLYACRMCWLYGAGAPEVTLGSVLRLCCDEGLWAESAGGSGGHLYASLASGPSHQFEPSEEPQALSTFLWISFPS